MDWKIKNTNCGFFKPININKKELAKILHNRVAIKTKK